MEKTKLALKPLTPLFGAEVVDFDIPSELCEESAPLLREAWQKHGLLLFRNQTLSPEQQLDFAQVFGDVSLQGDHAVSSGGYRYISNVAADGLAGIGELMLHMDHTFFPTPLSGLMLYAIEVPSQGGHTVFASNKVAYDLLPHELQDKIADKSGLHVMDYDIYKIRKHVVRFRDAEAGPNAPRAVHPLALVHPKTGERLLYISRRHLDRILDLPEEESEALLEELLSFLGRPENGYEHAWTPGDLIVWDNFALQHARTAFDPSEHRHLRRIQIT